MKRKIPIIITGLLLVYSCKKQVFVPENENGYCTQVVDKETGQVICNATFRYTKITTEFFAPPEYTSQLTFSDENGIVCKSGIYYDECSVSKNGYLSFSFGTIPPNIIKLQPLAYAKIHLQRNSPMDIDSIYINAMPTLNSTVLGNPYCTSDTTIIKIINPATGYFKWTFKGSSHNESFSVLGKDTVDITINY